MLKTDDSSLDPEQRQAVEARARALLNRASAWDRFPTPIEDILEAAQLKIAKSNAFDAAHVMAYIAGKAAETAKNIKSALSKVFGIYDANESVIHIDGSVAGVKQTFLKLHETGHHEMPVHRKLFSIFQECKKTLEPGIADLFEREANNFARFALFQNDRFGLMAADMPMAIKTPMKLAPKFGASVYAACREFARTSHRECMVYVLEPAELLAGHGFRSAVRRVEYSPAFLASFGPSKTVEITPDHALGDIVPIGRKMTAARSISITDLNGDKHEAVVEAFDTTRNVIILLYTVRSLKKSTFIMPAGSAA